MKRSHWYWLSGSMLVLLLLAGSLIWLLPDPHLIHTFSVGQWVMRVAISPDGEYIAASSIDDRVRVWQRSTTALLHTLTAYPCVSPDLAFTPDGQSLAVSYQNGAVLLWDVTTGEQIRHLIPVQPIRPGERDHCFPQDDQGDGRSISTLSISPDGRFVAAGTHWQVRVSHIQTGELQCELTVERVRFYDSVFSPDSTLLLASNSRGKVYLLDAATCELLDVLEPPIYGDTDFITALTFVPGGQQLLLVRREDADVEVWSVPDRQRLSQRDAMPYGSSTWAFTPDGRVFVRDGPASRGVFMDSGLPFWGGRDDPTIYLGPVTSVVGTAGDILPTVRLHGHREDVTDFAFSADGQLLVSSSADGTVRLWRVPEIEE